MCMKKKICLIATLLVFVGTIGAASFSDFTRKENYIPQSALIGLGNDKWSFGFSINNDDQLSFSESIRLEAPVWYFYADFDGITNRGWKDGWTTGVDSIYDPGIGGEFYQGRYDLYKFVFGLNIDLINNSILDIYAKPEAGLALAGNLGQDFCQNLVHKMSGIPQVHIPYEKGFKTLASLNLDLGIDLKLYKLGSYYLTFSPELRFDNLIGFSSQQLLSAGVSVKNSDRSLLSVNFGYEWAQSFSSWETEKLYADFLNGVTVNFEINAGFLRLDYYSTWSNAYGYGVYSIDVMSLFEKPTYKKTDFYYYIGFARLMRSNFHESELGVKLNDGFSVIYKNRYIAGEAFYVDNLKSNYTDNTRYKKNISSHLVGFAYDYSFDQTKNYLDLYAEFSLGLMHWDVRNLTNMDPEATVPWITEERMYSFMADVEVGLNILPEGLIKTLNNTYTIRLGLGCSWISNYNDVELDTVGNELNKDIKDMYGFVPRVSVGVNVGFDLN